MEPQLSKMLITSVDLGCSDVSWLDSLVFLQLAHELLEVVSCPNYALIRSSHLAVTNRSDLFFVFPVGNADDCVDAIRRGDFLATKGKLVSTCFFFRWNS